MPQLYPRHHLFFNFRPHFPLPPPIFVPIPAPLSIPAKAGISLFTGASNARTAPLHCNLRRWRGSQEIPAFAGMGGRTDGDNFLPSAACGGGCEREAVAGGGEWAMMVGVPPPPKNSLARIFTPPRKRRRVRQSAISLIPASDFHSRPPLLFPPPLSIPASHFHSRSLFPFLPPLPFLRRQESLRRQPHSPTGDHSASRNFPLTREEIPAFAGMEVWRRRE